MKVAKRIITIPISLIIFGVIYCEINKAYWDHQVKKMCEKDGGVTVYQKINLTPEELKVLGGYNFYVRAPAEKYAKTFDQYVSVSADYQINATSPYVYRSETTILRRSDKNPLGKEVSYSRVGGDFPSGIMSESSFSCGNIKNFNANLTKSIFF